MTPEEIVDKLFADAYKAGKRRQLESGPVIAAIRGERYRERRRCAKIAFSYEDWEEDPAGPSDLATVIALEILGDTKRF